MKKTETIKKNYEFKTILKKGTCAVGEYIAMYHIKNELSNNRIGIAISKKIGKSVVRNKLKRLFREGYKELEKLTTDGNDMIFVWKKNKSLDNATFFNIKEDMR